MGLSFHVDGYEFECRWSYTNFYEFRKKLAYSIGIELEEMQGFRKKHPIDEGYIKIGYKSWDSIKSPLKHFLNHCDSSGKIDSKKCIVIASILKIILVLWEDDGGIHKTNGFSLVAAMEHCAEFNKDLIFS
jgi:hypothetical protein